MREKRQWFECTRYRENNWPRNNCFFFFFQKSNNLSKRKIENNKTTEKKNGKTKENENIKSGSGLIELLNPIII